MIKTVAADTHAAVWLLGNDKQLSKTALSAFDAAERVMVPSICLVEIIYLIEKRRLPPAVLPRLVAEFSNPATTLTLVPLDMGVVLALPEVSRDAVPDLPDRIIAATALYHGVPLVTRDGKIQASGIKTIW